MPPPRASRCLSIMNIHGARKTRWARRRRKACRLWTGGGPRRVYRGRGGGILCRHAHSLLLLCCTLTIWSCSCGKQLLRRSLVQPSKLRLQRNLGGDLLQQGMLLGHECSRRAVVLLSVVALHFLEP